MPSTKAKKIKALAIVSGALGVLVIPAPIAAVAVVSHALMAIPKAQRSAELFSIVPHALSVWASSHGYLPWSAWPVVLSSQATLIAWAGLTLFVFAFLAVQVTKGSSSRGTGYGGPVSSGKGEHGTARWRTPAEVSASLVLWSAKPKKGMENPSGIYLGQGPVRQSMFHQHLQPSTAWVLNSDQHVLLVGSPGSRKTRGVILPAIGVIGSAKRESMVISDPKGELYAHTAKWLRSQGYAVVRLDLRDPSRGNRWNPMRGVVQALAEGHRDEASALAWDIAHLLGGSLEGGGGSDPYWRIAGEALIASLVLAVSQGKPPLSEGVNWPTVAQRHMASVYAALISGGAGGEMLDDWIEQFPPNHPAYKAYGPIRLSEDKQRVSILGTAAVALQQFADDETAWLTSDQDHALADVGRKPTAVFLVIPDERSTRYPLATLYIQQTLQALAALADQHGGRLPIGVNFLLDEFGNLPQIKDFDKTVTVSRGRGIRIVLVLQDLAQLKRHYGDAAQTVKGSMSVWVYLRTAEIETAREIAAKLGQYTVAAENLSVPRVTWWTTSATVGAASTTHSLQARDLLTAEEVLRWPLGRALVLQAGQLPTDLPLPDLSAWASVWPHIQARVSEPQSQQIEEPPTWRLGDDFDLSLIDSYDEDANGGNIDGQNVTTSPNTDSLSDNTAKEVLPTDDKAQQNKVQW